MRHLLDHGHRIDIGGIACVLLKRADAALAQDDTRIAIRQDVFGGHEQFFDVDIMPA